MKDLKKRILVNAPEKIKRNFNNGAEMLLMTTFATVGILSTIIYEINMPSFTYSVLTLPLIYSAYIVVYNKIELIQFKINSIVDKKEV